MLRFTRAYRSSAVAASIRRLSTAAPASAKVVVTARCFDATLNLLRSAPHCGAVVSNTSTEPWTRQELVARAHDADALVCFMTDTVDAELLDACPKLSLVACALKGFDNFDVAECGRRGVAVTAVPDLLTAPTAELALALALGLGRRTLEADANVRTGEFKGWRPTLYGRGLAGATVGLFGAGAVGCAVAARLAGFAPAAVLYHDTSALTPEAEASLGLSRCEGGLEGLVARCDVLFVCTPLTPHTRHALSGPALRAAKPGLLLVNVSRGSCVSEAAVADALEAGTLGGYAADVFEFEDWAWAGRPERIEPRLRAHPATLLSPHLGSAVETTRREIELAAAGEVVRWLRGEPYHHRVN